MPGRPGAAAAREPIDPDKLPDAPKAPPDNTGNHVIMGVSGTVALYACYRVVRFLPSLFPALGPTIPVNVAVP